MVAFCALALRKRYSPYVLVASAFLGFASFAWFAEWRRSPLPEWATKEGEIEAEIAKQLNAQGGRILYSEWLWSSGIAADRARMFGIPSVNWYGPLIPKHAGELLQEVESGATSVRSLRSENVALDIYGVRYVAVRDGVVAQNISKQEPLGAPRWRQVGRERDVSYYENARAQPLGWLCGSWRSVSAKEALQSIQDAPASGFDPRREALVTDLPSGGKPGSDIGYVDARWDGPGTIRASVDARENGFLLFSVNHMPGWTATIDGTSWPTYIADYALIGLPVAPGRHSVVLHTGCLLGSG